MARTLHPPPDMARRGMGGKEEEGEEPCRRRCGCVADLLDGGGRRLDGPCGMILQTRVEGVRPVRPIREPVVGVSFSFFPLFSIDFGHGNCGHSVRASMVLFSFLMPYTT